MPLSARVFSVSMIIVSISAASDSLTSLSPQPKNVSRLSASNPVPSESVLPRPESIRALRKGDAEFPRRICSSRASASTSKGSLISVVSHATQTWHFFDASSFLSRGYGYVTSFGLSHRGWQGTSVFGSMRSQAGVWEKSLSRMNAR